MRNIAAKLCGVDSSRLSACESEDAVVMSSETEQNTGSFVSNAVENTTMSTTSTDAETERLRNKLSLTKDVLPEREDIMRSTSSLVDDQLAGTSGILSLVELSIVDAPNNIGQLRKHWPELLDPDNLFSKRDLADADILCNWNNEVEKNSNLIKYSGDNDNLLSADQSCDISYLHRKCESSNTGVS